ncbi:MAG: PKD domain-containing protein [Thermoleophilia bacterium]|nr:PKD domain-containing protein [Thermoleophilia bacterium]
MRTRSSRLCRLLGLAAVATTLLALQQAVVPAGAAPATVAAGGWVVNKYVAPGTPAVCAGANFAGSYFDKLDCGSGRVKISGATATSVVRVLSVAEDGTVVDTRNATFTASTGVWSWTVAPTASWIPGRIALRVTVDGVAATGEGEIFYQALGASIAPDQRAGGYRPGDPIPLAGHLFEQDDVGADTAKKDVSGSYYLRVRTASGAVRGPYGPFTANRGGEGQIRETLPPSATAGLTATRATNYETTVGLEVVDASYADLVTGAWKASSASAGFVTVSVPPNQLVLENTFVSAVGWVKPGETYPFRVFVKNFDWTDRTGAVVRIPAADGVTFTRVAPNVGSGTATINSTGTAITWTVGTVPARTDAGPGLRTLVVEAKADTLAQDPQLIWKNLSTTATLTYTGGTAVTDTSKGPKVVPPKETYDSARYGFRPFPVVPVDYRDRKHDPSRSAERLLSVINSPDVPGSTFNLFQEMSYGQLFPSGDVPSAAIGSSDFGVAWKSPHRQARGFDFSLGTPGGACYGATTGKLAGTPLYNERIRNGWYQLPGDTGYYGGDKTGFANVLVPNSGFIDSACGSIAKGVYDAALIADPEIDYSDFDTDKDGVVDFFMMVFVGSGGNGASQVSASPYDNIWPHSSSLEQYFKDPDTGQTGYVSDDQLRDNEGRLLYYTDASRGAMTTAATAFPVYVRVGPYNVNPESAIERASVISHEYGHSLGLPDFYSSPGRETYGDWNLMATDKSQHMDVYSKQELGWIVPRVLGPGETTVTGWRDSKLNTHRIDWVTPGGQPYTLTGPNVANGEAYAAKLPGQKIISAEKVATSASGSHVWWSKSGNDFGCAPITGHNLDINLPDLATVPAGTPVTLTFKSYWDIEWDFDYGFVLTSTDGGSTYQSVASRKGYSTPASLNPNDNACQATYGNGLTGTTQSYVDSTFAVDRNPLGPAYPDGPFTTDEYDLTSLAGKAAVLRFSYSTDPGLARPGWFVDDVKVTAGDRVLYESDFEHGASDPRLFNGGCSENLQVANACTAGWQYVNASDDAVQDHAYYLELRDRSGFDASGKAQNDRAPIGFFPGLLLTYTNEIEGYGNTGEGSDDTPNQSPLDSQPQPGSATPNLDDAAFTAASGDNRFSDAGTGWIDNYVDAGSSYGDQRWHLDFNCLTFDVLSLTGDEVGPETVPGDLTGSVRFATGPGCGAFDYRSGVDTNVKPTAVAQAKPTSAKLGQRVRFDGSASFDDRDAPTALAYAWDYDGNGVFDATGRNPTHRYNLAGTFQATLRVTDSAGLTDTDAIAITVAP